MKKTIEYNGKSYTLTTPVGNCFECEYEKPCKNFHCSGAMCGITEFCIGHTGKYDYCPFKEKEPEKPQKTTRCSICGKEFTDAEIEGATKCPNCGTKSLPCAISDDVQIKINWHELRILTIWAENWARKCDAEESERDEKMMLSVMTIAERLQRQFPDKTKLTLFGEIRDLRKDYDIETNIDNDELLGL